MIIYAPDYYKNFKCIASRCRHNCCIGWEIDIDEDTYEKYKGVKGDFAQKLHSGISTDGEPHFCLTHNERCPFLNNENLCDIIINLGEDYLCQICDDHPRFSNFFDHREEIGLGLCCEAAAELILTREKKTKFIPIAGTEGVNNTEEQAFFAERNNVFEILQNRDLSVNRRIKVLCGKYEILLPEWDFVKWAETLRKLERLDNSWDACLDKLSHIKSIDYTRYSTMEWEIAREQLLVYFVYRHMADGFYENNIRERLSFAIISDMLVTAMCSATSEKIKDIARQYSSEIEYSEDNLNTIIDILTQNYIH